VGAILLVVRLLAGQNIDSLHWSVTLEVRADDGNVGESLLKPAIGSVVLRVETTALERAARVKIGF
jgi:hypothetical protein